jgi:predicted nucleotidyltransferase
LPLPQGHGSFRPGVFDARIGLGFASLLDQNAWIARAAIFSPSHSSNGVSSVNGFKTFFFSHHAWPLFENRIDGLRHPRKYLRVMRKSLVLDALFPAIRQQILAATLLEPQKWWYLTELASHLGTSPSSLQRELGALTRSGLLEHRQDGRRTYYKANTASPVFSELHELFGKTAGIIPTLQAEFIRFGNKIPLAFIYGSIAREKEQAHSDVDLMVIGSISTADLVPMLKRLEQGFQREINVTRYSEKEFKQKIQNKDHFLLSVLNEKVVMIKGAQDELEAATCAT